ncbi:3-oxoadipate enol-lactonase/4-carboxymuconolactone decarboxylase [Mumia flava]|uniref:3-oxoadipate enol-lactonase/4-carboxymuconolactone decarboxylase n=1 Tax=Mumia flava TaxID=1348852 RepID=A0A0B2B783_9ACTN|nr:4-carboxymuconolactone decarboxylase [Mumia flava]PJJ57542.1 3-oxoadipate enol-lactonase/4-carboxymuconolactone decarboxylase [Mumia flava]
MTVPTLPATELAGDASRPLLIVGPSLGTTCATLWASTARLLGDVFHVVGWDLPGHGGAPVGGAFTMAELARGVLELADRVGVARGDAGTFAYAGDSVGGAVGLQLLLDDPDRVDAAVLLCTGARIGDEAMWRDRAALVRTSGTPSMVAGSAERWFAPGFLDREPATGSALLHALSDTDDEGYAQVCDALATFDVRGRLGEIATPVLTIAGAHDGPTPPESLAAIAHGVQHGRSVVLGEAAHLAPAEAPETVAALLRGHLQPVPTPIRRVAEPSADADRAATRQIADGADGDAYARGMAVRRAVLGDAHVDRATERADDLTAPFQELITRYAWGEVWGRDGLDRPTRSMLTLALLAALGHEAELAMHVRAALRNGLTREQVAEVLIHTGVYAGVPVSNSALGVMQRVFAEIDAADGAL